MRWLAASALVALAACPGGGQHEVCGNNVDDDGNGLVDCQDPDCSGQPACSPYLYGTCVRCGATCAVQGDCVAGTGWLYEHPVPVCAGDARCYAVETAVQLNVQLDVSVWSSLGSRPKTVLVRFLKRTAADGSPVTCARVLAAAPGTTADKVLQLESTNTFVVQGIDSFPMPTTFSQFISLPFLNTNVGADYLTYIETWYGPRDATTKLPTLNRAGKDCFEAPALTPAITPDANCPSTTSDAGSCLTLSYVISSTTP